MAQPHDFPGLEIDVVGEPDAIIQPACLLPAIQRPHAEAGIAVGVLVVRLGQTRVQPLMQPLLQACE